MWLFVIFDITIKKKLFCPHNLGINVRVARTTDPYNGEAIRII
jgi:hypothetical protein